MVGQNNYNGMGAGGLGVGIGANKINFGLDLPGTGLDFSKIGLSSNSTSNSIPSTSDTSGINASIQTPQAKSDFGGNFFKSANGQWNTDNMQMLAGGLETIGKLYMAFQQARIARESLGLQKEMFQENLQNQRTSYNNALEDRIKSRGTFTRADPTRTQQEIERKSL